ncbi:hypothetical protein MMC13_000314 [Lambiella insularis]|nr:hypothetical protein [Lambiella insularis]
MIDSREGLSIAELVFYVPGLFLAAFVAFRHGFGRESGWIFLVILSLIRIIGSICEIVSVSSPSQGVDECYIILASVGLSPLILAMLGLLKRVHQSMSTGSFLPPRILNLLGIIPIVALILAIVGGTDQSSSNPGTVSTGVTLSRVGVVLFMVVFVVLALITLATFFKFRSITSGEDRVLIAIALAVPFLFVRLIYSLLANFSGNPDFNFVTGNVVIEACMDSLMEFVVVILFLGAGLLAPKIPKSNVRPGIAYEEAGMASQGSVQPVYSMNEQRPVRQEYMDTSPHKPQGYERGGRRGRRSRGPIHALINRYT